MKEYKVVVDGTEFHVSVESLGGTSRLGASASSVQAIKPAPVYAPKAAPAAPSVPAPAPAPAAAPAASSGPAGGGITAPMPGSVLDIKVKAGDKVNVGDVVMLLEAMKMEIEVSSTVSGTVKGIAVSKGSSVNTGDVLVTVE